MESTDRNEETAGSVATVTVSNIDVGLMRSQRNRLLEYLDTGYEPEDFKSSVEGIVGLLDAALDDAEGYVTIPDDGQVIDDPADDIETPEQRVMAQMAEALEGLTSGNTGRKVRLGIGCSLVCEESGRSYWNDVRLWKTSRAALDAYRKLGETSRAVTTARMSECVRACDGIVDPEEAIQQARQALEALGQGSAA